jgi:signal transduction histidine kinase
MTPESQSRDLPDPAAGPPNLRTVPDLTEVEALRQELARRSDELHEATSKLRAEATARNEFIARMSHQFRTPLSAVLGFGQLLELEPLDPIATSYAQQIARGGQRLLELVDAIREFSDLEAGLVAPSLEPVGCEAAVLQATDLIEHIASARGIRVSVAPVAGGACVLADPGFLRRILVHLLTNAVTFNRDNGAVVVEVAPAGPRTRLVVTDTGAGLGDDELARLFVPFERLRATERGIDGAGFGLASSRLSAALMNGQLTATSVEGKGSSFTLELPNHAPGPPTTVIGTA